VSGDLIQQLLDEIATLTEQNSELATNYVGLLDSLAAERALADQLASHLEWALRCVGSLPMELRTTFDNRMAEVLAAHQEARRER
jgi:hypothetical protein